jgi:hypothetical protein
MAIYLKAGGRSIALCLALIVGLGVAAPSQDAEARRRYRKRASQIAPGVRFMRWVDRRGPNRIKILRVNLAARTTLDTVLARDKLPGFEKTKPMAGRSGAVAAINGDYARPSGRPVHTFAFDGYLAQTELSWGRNFSVDAGETQAFIGHPKRNGWVTETDSGETHAYRNRVNQDAARRGQIARFTSLAGTEEQPPRQSCMAHVSPVESPHTVSEGVGVETAHVVDEVACPGPSMSPQPDSSVLQAPYPNGTFEPAIGALQPGEQVVLGWSLGWPGVLDTIGGNPTLIENGAVQWSNVTGTGSFFDRHPRTGVGYSSFRDKVFLVTVDGRRKGSVGMTLKQFARLFKRLGADWALNLDGGGSTTMVVNGRVVNTPSDRNHVQRAVSSSIVILPGKDPGEAPEPSEPEESLLPVNDALAARRILTDPASTGGLASYLRSIGRRLPPELRRAADAFEASR